MQRISSAEPGLTEEDSMSRLLIGFMTLGMIGGVAGGCSSASSQSNPCIGTSDPLWCPVNQKCCPTGYPYDCNGSCYQSPPTSECGTDYDTCGSTSSTDAGTSSTDPVDEIINGTSAATAATYWSCAGEYQGCGSFAFYSDGTYETRAFTGEPGETASLVTGTWTKIGPAALVMNPGSDIGTSLTGITGSLAGGSFNADTTTGAADHFGIAGGSP